MAPTTVDRDAALERAGWNVLHLDPFDIEHDLLTDVPARSFVREVAEAGCEAALGRVREPDLAALAAELYGPALYTVATKGRAAEAALLSAIGKLAVVTHGLFRSTQHAIAKYAGGPIEIAPHARAGSSDLDLEWLKARLERGGVGAVYLEPSNNALGGWLLSLEHVRAVKALCVAHGALLLLDGCRLLANVLALGLPLGAAHDFTRAADAFTVSCSKELLTPYGALAAVRDPALHHKVQSFCMEEGTLLEPLDARVRLAAGMRRILGDPSPIVARGALVHSLARALAARGVSIVEPPGAHAVYVRTSLPPGEPMRARGLEARLFLDHGVRAIAIPNPLLNGVIMRLPLVVGMWDEAALTHIAEGVARTLSDETSHLALEVSEPGPNPMLGRYRRKP